MSINQILKSMRADSILEGHSGLWTIKKYKVKKYLLSPDKKQLICPGNFTQLSRLTLEKVHIGGECVMADYEAELRKHLQFILKAKGRILVSGLGLGCVVRGLLCKPEVVSVDILEKEKDVIKLVWPHMPTDSRLKLHHKNALRFSVNGASWDFAWHDIWTEGNINLAKKHATLIARFSQSVKNQGAWNFPREIKRMCRLVA